MALMIMCVLQPSRSYQQQQQQQQSGYKRNAMSPTTAMPNTAQYTQGSWSTHYYKNSGAGPSHYNPQHQQLAVAYGSYTHGVSISLSIQCIHIYGR